MTSSHLPIDFHNPSNFNSEVPQDVNSFTVTEKITFKNSVFNSRVLRSSMSLSRIKKFIGLAIIPSILNITRVSAHREDIGNSLDTGKSLSTLTYVFVGFGILVFVLIMLSAVWLIRREKVELEDPQTYGEKINSFGKNARLYILHIQGMSLTYGVRVILYNLYILFLFPNGLNVFGREFRTLFFIGFLLALGSLAAGVMAPWNGIVVDKIGKKWSFIMGDFVGATMVLSVVFFQDPYWIITAQIIRAGIMSIHGIAEGPFIYENSTDKERVHLFGVSSGMSTMANMSGNLIGGLVPLGLALLIYSNTTLNNSQAIFVFQIGLIVAVIFWWGSLIPAYFMTEDPVLREKAKSMSVSSKMKFKNVTNWRTIWVFVLSSVFIGFGAGMFVQFFELFFIFVFAASPAEIAIIFGLGSLFVATGNLASPVISEKFGKVNMIVLTRFISIIFILLLPLATKVGSNGLALAGIFYLLRSFFQNSTAPSENALAMEAVNDEERTTMEAMRMAGASIFAAIGYLVGGYLMSIDNFVLPFVLAAMLYSIALLVFWAHFRNWDGIKIESMAAVPTAGD